jgi:hypothetical protein
MMFINPLNVKKRNANLANVFDVIKLHGVKMKENNVTTRKNVKGMMS